MGLSLDIVPGSSQLWISFAPDHLTIANNRPISIHPRMLVYIVVKPPNLRDLAAWCREDVKINQAPVVSRLHKVQGVDRHK